MALARAGANVAVCGRNTEDLKRVSDAIKQLEGIRKASYWTYPPKRVFMREWKRLSIGLGKIDILMNNAGLNHRVPVLEYPEDAWDLVINTNLKGYFLVAQAVAPHMLEKGYGKIINMGSILGRIAIENQLAYASAKGGVVQMTKVMALEWAKKGIRVNSIGPPILKRKW
jgi:NAD(P)-dependent dehydrogenase (short-subunit alcohol dehydrogenase family)